MPSRSAQKHISSLPSSGTKPSTIPIFGSHAQYVRKNVDSDFVLSAEFQSSEEEEEEEEEEEAEEEDEVLTLNTKSKSRNQKQIAKMKQSVRTK
jgi:hypothetical protein